MFTIVMCVLEKNTNVLREIWTLTIFLNIYVPAQEIARFLIHTRDFQKCLLNKKKMEAGGKKEREGERKREGFEI